jgi:L-asparaginase
MNIAIVLLGGTISYQEPRFDNQFIYDLFKQSRILDNYTIYNFFEGNSVSLYENKEKTKEIFQKIRSLNEDKILLLMGTDRMVQFGREIKKKISDKTIIITGAIVPYEQRITTDSIFNVGYALGNLVNIKERDVFIAMNGRLFNPDLVVKNYKSKTFESVRI